MTTMMRSLLCLGNLTRKNIILLSPPSASAATVSASTLSSSPPVVSTIPKVQVQVPPASQPTKFSSIYNISNSSIGEGNLHRYHHQQQQQQRQYEQLQQQQHYHHRICLPHRSRSFVTITQTKVSDENVIPSSSLFPNEDGNNNSNDDDDDDDDRVHTTYSFNPDTTLIVTESCLNRVETLLKQRRQRQQQADVDDVEEDDGYFLRVYVDAGGCSGFQYQFEIDNELDVDDNDGEDEDEDECEDVIIVSRRKGSSSISSSKSSQQNNDIIVDDQQQSQQPMIVIDKTSLGFLEGSKIDYVQEMIKSSFVVADNPQSESACGCGSSFAIKNFQKFGTKD